MIEDEEMHEERKESGRRYSNLSSYSSSNILNAPIATSEDAASCVVNAISRKPSTSSEADNTSCGAYKPNINSESLLAKLSEVEKQFKSPALPQVQHRMVSHSFRKTDKYTNETLRRVNP